MLLCDYYAIMTWLYDKMVMVLIRLSNDIARVFEGLKNLGLVNFFRVAEKYDI